MKTCGRCKIEKTDEEFYRNKGRYDGLSGYCRTCQSGATGAHQAAVRRSALDALGDKCAHCEIEDIRVLVIDHREGGGRAERTIKSPSVFYKHVAANPDGYQLLCHNCNHLKRIERGEHTGPRLL